MIVSLVFFCTGRRSVYEHQNETKDEFRVHLWNTIVMEKPLMFGRFRKEQNLVKILQGMCSIYHFCLNSGNAAWCIWKVVTMSHDTKKSVSQTSLWVYYFSMQSWTDNTFFGVAYVICLGSGFFFNQRNYQYTIQILPKCIGDWNDFGT